MYRSPALRETEPAREFLIHGHVPLGFTIKVILGLHWDTEKQNGNYNLGFVGQKRV